MDALITGGVTLEQVEAIGKLVGKEPIFIPWYEDGVMVGMITGIFDSDQIAFPGDTVAFLEHFIVTPAAKRKLEVMQLFPVMVARLLKERGATRIVTCVHHVHPRARALRAWGRRVGWTEYIVTDTATWITYDLKEIS